MKGWIEVWYRWDRSAKGHFWSTHEDEKSALKRCREMVRKMPGYEFFIVYKYWNKKEPGLFAEIP